ncbi:MAG: TrkA C-terminal domain-containing protein [Desulfobulbaceae bacterium]|uniref:TrkA C-terminal domain-containing protein n=1 Tax=Candidatus Desulfobia pelagia TaxID=2841692 RepID=A0A8J6NCE0_9BACT|nr:TrkA C-terminal domain-containing protein [Candidatus Desulfobia pelagia]
MHEIGLVVIMTQAVFANITVFKQVEGRFLTLINTLVSVGVITTLAAFYFSIAASYMPSGTPFAAFIVVSAGSLLFLWQRIKLLDNRIETLFLESFEEQLNKEEIERRHKMNEIARQYPWPVEISELEILSGSESCGKKIRALQIRSLTGATIIGVSRQDYVQYNPGIDTMIFPNDHLFLFGKEDQIKAARSLLTREKTESDDDVNRGKIKIDTLYIGLDSELNHKSLIASGNDTVSRFSAFSVVRSRLPRHLRISSLSQETFFMS